MHSGSPNGNGDGGSENGDGGSDTGDGGGVVKYVESVERVSMRQSAVCVDASAVSVMIILVLIQILDSQAG